MYIYSRPTRLPYTHLTPSSDADPVRIPTSFPWTPCSCVMFSMISFTASNARLRYGLFSETVSYPKDGEERRLSYRYTFKKDLTENTLAKFCSSYNRPCNYCRCENAVFEMGGV